MVLCELDALVPDSVTCFVRGDGEVAGYESFQAVWVAASECDGGDSAHADADEGVDFWYEESVEESGDV